jgi:hypothetical protein
MTNPEENTCVTSTPPLEPQVVSTTIASTKRQSGKKASTQSAPTKRRKSQPKSEYNLKDLMKNPIVQASAAQIQEIEKLSQSEDDPPLIFFWDAKILGVFLQNMVQVPADVAIPPPQLQPAVVAGVGDDDSCEKVLARCIMDYLQSRVPGIVRLSNDRAGFGCTQIQFANMIHSLCVLHNEPWFAAVCSVGALGGPLAQFFITRPRSRTGVIDRFSAGGPLWS